MKMTKTLVSVLLIAVLLAACASVPQTQPNSTPAQTQQQPTTATPTTQPAPTTQPVPTTQPTPTTQPAPTAPPTEPAPQLAPDFTVYDDEGNALKLSDLVGKPVIVNCWASWCFPCLAELPHFNKMYQAYGDQIQFLMVHMTAFDAKEEGKAIVAQRGYTFPVFFDTDASAAQAYQVSAIPATFAIDAEGYLVETFIGSMSEKELQALIDQLLAVE